MFEITSRRVTMIIVIAHIKGGTGKTTTATQVALCRQIQFPERKVWLVDADEQQSALDTISIRSELNLQPALACSAYTTGKQLLSQLNSQARIWDDIIIDCGGRDTETLRIAMLGADKLIVPVLPRAYDVWSLSRLEAVIQAANNYRTTFKKKKLPVYAFINRMDRSAECKEAVAYLETSKVFHLMESSLSDRMAYAKAGGQGKSVLEMKPKDRKAFDEIQTFTEEAFRVDGAENVSA